MLNYQRVIWVAPIIYDQAWWPPLECSMNPETCGQRRIPTWKRTVWPEVILANWSDLVWWFIPSIQIVILRMVYSFYHTNYYSWNIVHYGKKYTYSNSLEVHPPFHMAIYNIYCLVVKQPLRKIWQLVSWDDDSFPTEWKVIRFHGSSHHQPDILIIDYHILSLSTIINYY